MKETQKKEDMRNEIWQTDNLKKTLYFFDYACFWGKNVIKKFARVREVRVLFQCSIVPFFQYDITSVRVLNSLISSSMIKTARLDIFHSNALVLI